MGNKWWKSSAEDKSSAESNKKDIKVPILDILTTSMNKYKSDYREEFIFLLRRFYIACLNLGFIQPYELESMVEKFVSKINKIVVDQCVSEHKPYAVVNKILYIDKSEYMLSDEQNMLVERDFFRAAVEIITGSDDELISLNNAFCSMTSEKLINMSFNKSFVVKAKLCELTISKETVELRAGYEQNCLIIELLKQYFIALKINENFIIKDAFENSYEFSVKKYLKKFISDGYSKLLDKIYFFEVIREKFNYEDSLEIDLINKYQILVNDLFETFDDENYLVFLALVTDENLRNKFKKNIDS